MKTQSPTTAAYRYLFSPYVNFRYCPTSCHRAPKVDKRTKFGRAVLAEYYRLKDEKAVLAAIDKQKRRRESAKVTPSNILSNPIVKDWISNRDKLTVTPEKLTDGYRNHWAKSDKDRRILAILAKYSRKTLINK